MKIPESTGRNNDAGDWFGVIHDVAYRVRALCNSEAGVGWIAKQSVSERQPYDDCYGFVIGDGITSVRYSEAVNADDALIRRLATEVMGYAPGSVEDLQERKRQAQKKLNDALEREQVARDHIALYDKVIEALDAKIAEQQRTARSGEQE